MQHPDGPRVEVEVLRPQRQRFADPDPRSIQHRDGKTTVDFLMPDVEVAEVEKWNSLKSGDTVHFRIKLSGFVLALGSDMMRSDVQDLRDKSTPVIIVFMVNDARIVNQLGPSVR